MKRPIRQYIDLIVKVSEKNLETSFPGGIECQLRTSRWRGQTKIGWLWKAQGKGGDPEFRLFWRASYMNDP